MSTTTTNQFAMSKRIYAGALVWIRQNHERDQLIGVDLQIEIGASIAGDEEAAKADHLSRSVVDQSVGYELCGYFANDITDWLKEWRAYF